MCSEDRKGRRMTARRTLMGRCVGKAGERLLAC